jgi:hypothetical protein
MGWTFVRHWKGIQITTAIIERQEASVLVVAIHWLNETDQSMMEVITLVEEAAILVCRFGGHAKAGQSSAWGQRCNLVSISDLAIKTSRSNSRQTAWTGRRCNAMSRS